VVIGSGATAVVLPMDDKKRWVFKTTQNDGLISEALIGHMVKHGVKTVGVIGFNDPYGDNWYSVFSAQAQQAGIKVVANEKFLRTDASVTGQVAKLMSAKPDAVLVAAAGGPTVLPHVTLVDAGYKGRIYQTHGAATMDTLISMGTLSAFLWSLYALFLGTAGEPGMTHPFSLTLAPSDGAANIYLEVAAGVTMLDTSDIYGPHTNEILIGKVCSGL
jgi:ABC-type branched-subunit amino acid transport system substrate-binding protein